MLKHIVFFDARNKEPWKTHTPYCLGNGLSCPASKFIASNGTK